MNNKSHKSQGKNKNQRKIGVLLANLGSPEGSDYGSMRRYLKQFLSDKRVVETSRFIWYPVFYTLILSMRPQKSGEKYERIWNYAAAEAPLFTQTRAQAQKLQHRLSENKQGTECIRVDWAMRYGVPSIADVSRAMIADGCEKLLIFPLYPQYSAATTASVMDDFFNVLKQLRFLPAVRSVPSYPEDPVYIEALVSSVKRQLATLSFVPQILLISYHGLPASYIERGDPYQRECQRTSAAFAAALKLALGKQVPELLTCYQSRFGRETWLQPYIDETVIKLAREGIRSIAVVSPGFVADCLETLDEIGHEVACLFRQHGGKNFARLSCLNDSEAGIDVIEAQVRRELSGWL